MRNFRTELEMAAHQFHRYWFMVTGFCTKSRLSESPAPETYGKQNTGNGGGPGWDERAFSTEVAEWPAGKSVQPARRKTRKQPRKQPICSRRKT